jgi:capsular polysaccharide biosynthesis protein
LLIPSHTALSGHYNKTAISGVRELLLQCYENFPSPIAAEKLYISRRKAKVRRLVNEGDVEAILAEYGFTTVCLEDYTFEEQVGIVSKARYMVSNHGAGLTNMMLLPSQANILELRKRGDGHNNCYFSLASCLRLRYFYQLCDPQDSSHDAYTADLRVQTESLRRNLDQMCVG